MVPYPLFAFIMDMMIVQSSVFKITLFFFCWFGSVGGGMRGLLEQLMDFLAPVSLKARKAVRHMKGAQRFKKLTEA